MSKPGLGKGLGDLMNGDQVAGKSTVVNAAASTTTTTSSDVALGRGLTTLVSPHRGDASTEGSQRPRRQLLPPWFFFSADILLLAFVVAIAFAAPRPFDLGTIVFCAVSVGVGALLAILGVFRVRD